MRTLTTLLAFAGLISTALAEIRVKTVTIPMRDGIRLSADLSRDPAVALLSPTTAFPIRKLVTFGWSQNVSQAGSI
jgi:predicted acyl esterase